MLQARGRPNFALEALRAQGLGQFRVEDLQRNWAVVPEVSRQVDRGHTPAPELPLKHVAIAKSIGQRRVDDGHESAWKG